MFQPFYLNLSKNSENIKKFQIDIKFDDEMKDHEETMEQMMSEGLSRPRLKNTEMDDEEFHDMIEFMKKRIIEMKEMVDKAYPTEDMIE